MYCSSTPFSFVKGRFALKPLTNSGVKLFCVQANCPTSCIDTGSCHKCLCFLEIILSNSQLYYGIIYPKIIESYTNEWIRKDINRDIRIGVRSFLYSLPMIIFIIGICILFHFNGFYPNLWQSTLCYICISSVIYVN